MDFSPMKLDDETMAFWRDVRAWFDDQMTDEVLEHEWATGDGFAAGVHRAMGERGWIFPTWPVEKGGAGLDAQRARIVALEQNLHHVPVPAGLSTTTLTTPALDRWLEGTVRDEIVRGATRGEIVICLGYTEPDGGSDLAGVRTRATRDGDEWVINGQKMFTTGAQHSDYSFLLARSDPALPKHKGLTMFLVPLDGPGVEIQAVHTLGGERTNMVFLDDVRVPDSLRVGPENQGWMVLHGPLNREHAMDEDGPKPLEEQPANLNPSTSPLAESLAATVEWAGELGVDGSRPIDDPTVRARLAEVALGLAVAAVTPGPPGRVLGSELFIRDASDLVDLVGPDALISRGQSGAVGDGIVEYAHRFAQGTAIYGGTTDIARNMIAERFMGMPRSRPSG
jgi:3-oxocholest-4-en-26-oyl-CoA dehydrogenase alpha subunit